METRSFLRRLGPLVALAAVVLTACSGRGPIGAAPAAQVGDRVVSMSDLDRYRDATHDAVLAAEADGSGQVMPGAAERFFVGTTPKGVPAEGVRTTLQDLIRLEAMKQVADELDVRVTDADRDLVRAEIPPEMLQTLPARYIDVQIEIAALQQAIGSMAEVDEDTVHQVFEDQKGGFTQVCLQMVGVSDEPSADEAARRLAAGEDFATVFEDLNTLPDAVDDAGVLPCQAAADLEPTFGPAIYEAEVDEVLETVRADEETWLVVQVRELDVPEFEDIEDYIRQNAAQMHVEARFEAVLRSVRVNPRLGVWNPETASVDPVAAPAPAGGPDAMEP